METVDADLGRLISKRTSQDRRPDPDELDPGYVESARRYQERMHATARVEWHLHHVSQAERLRRTLGDLIAFHEAEAQKYLLEKGA